MEKIKKETIKWEWENNWGEKGKGEYEGEVKKGKPNGLGKWKQDGDNSTIEGQWKDGKLNGKAVLNYSDGDRAEYEIKNGKINGKCILYMNDGGRV